MSAGVDETAEAVRLKERMEKVQAIFDWSDNLSLVGREDRRLYAREHPFHVLTDRLLRVCLNIRIGLVRFQRRFADALKDRQAVDPVEKNVRSEGERECREGRRAKGGVGDQGIAHSDLSCGLQPGEDAESPAGRKPAGGGAAEPSVPEDVQ